MSTVVNFNQRTIIEPGAYAQTRSAVAVKTGDASYGNVCIIDTGSGAGFGGGSGITGDLASNQDSIYSFNNANDARAFVRGGVLWDIIDYLFNPAKNAKGVDTLFIIKAALTTTAKISYTFTGGTVAGVNNQTLVTTTSIPASSGIKQVNTVVVGPYVELGDVYNIVLGADTLTYSAILNDTPSTVATALNALVTANILASGAFSVVTHSVTTNTVTLTATTNNTPFTQTSSTTNTTVLFAGPNGGIFAFETKNEGAGANGLTDEKQATGLINISLVSSGNVIPITVNSVLIGTYTTGSSSLSAARTNLLNSINTMGLTTGFKAVLQGASIKVTAPIGTGATANSYTFDLSGVTGATVTATAFVGGVDGIKVSKGYGSKLKAGIIDTTKYILEFYEGTWRGLDADGDDFGGITKYAAVPITIAKSIEFDNISDLITWAKNDFNFNQRFIVDDTLTSIHGDGSLDVNDFTNNNALVLATGGSDTYNTTQLDNVFPEIVELDNTFFLCDRWGDDAQDVENVKILNYIKNESEFEKFMIVGGGVDATKFTGSGSSMESAAFYDAAEVSVVHSGPKIPKLVGTGLKSLTAFYHAAAYLGRTAGLPPQTPGTFKNLRFNNFNHVMNKTQREQALQGGVVHSRFVPQIGWVINQSISTLQNNTQEINPDGTSYEMSISRIAAQLNKELVLNMRPVFVGNNQNTTSTADAKVFVEGYLTKKTAKRVGGGDNLIIRFENVVVTVVSGNYQVSYGYVPNGPVNKIFITSFLLDSNLSGN